MSCHSGSFGHFADRTVDRPAHLVERQALGQRIDRLDHRQLVEIGFADHAVRDAPSAACRRRARSCRKRTGARRPATSSPDSRAWRGSKSARCRRSRRWHRSDKARVSVAAGRGGGGRSSPLRSRRCRASRHAASAGRAGRPCRSAGGTEDRSRAAAHPRARAAVRTAARPSGRRRAATSATANNGSSSDGRMGTSYTSQGACVKRGKAPDIVRRPIYINPAPGPGEGFFRRWRMR